MNTSTIKQVNDKLKVLPENLLEEVEKYIDFLSFRYLQEDPSGIPQWQQDIVLDRVKNPKKSEDAFEMLEELEKEL